MIDVSLVQDSVARKFLNERLANIERVFAPEHIILLGSRASGTTREDSDIDLILVSNRCE